METIEESGEEDDQVDDDPSPLASNAEDSCPDLNETTEDYDNDEDEVFNNTEFNNQVNYLLFGCTTRR